MCAGGLKCQRTKRACLLCGRRATFEGLQSIMRRTAVSILSWQEDGGCEFHFRLRTKMRSVLSSSPAPVSSSFKLLTASHALHDSHIELLLFFLFFIFFSIWLLCAYVRSVIFRVSRPTCVSRLPCLPSTLWESAFFCAIKRWRLMIGS